MSSNEFTCCFTLFCPQGYCCSSFRGFLPKVVVVNITLFMNFIHFLVSSIAFPSLSCSSPGNSCFNLSARSGRRRSTCDFPEWRGRISLSLIPRSLLSPFTRRAADGGGEDPQPLRSSTHTFKQPHFLSGGAPLCLNKSQPTDVKIPFSLKRQYDKNHVFVYSSDIFLHFCSTGKPVRLGV